MSERKDDIELAIQLLAAVMQGNKTVFHDSEPSTVLAYLEKLYLGIQKLRKAP